MYFLLQKCEKKNEQEKKLPEEITLEKKRLGNGVQGGKIKNVKSLKSQSIEERRKKKR